MARVDTRDMGRSEDGFTLVELVVVLVLIATLLGIAVASYKSARVRTSDTAAESNIDVAVPAFQAYYVDNNGTYVGMTLAKLQASYSKGVQNITIVAARASDYCIRSTVNGRNWYKLGPSGAITTTKCT